MNTPGILRKVLNSLGNTADGPLRSIATFHQKASAQTFQLQYAVSPHHSFCVSELGLSLRTKQYLIGGKLWCSSV